MLTSVAIVACLFSRVVRGEYHSSLGFARLPTYDDFEDVKAIVIDYIHKSDCRDENSTFWNATISDCDYMPMERNPSGLGSRLVRHAFHDATGFSDGFVDLNNPENNGLQNSTILLHMMYEESSFSDGGRIDEVMTFADFCGWAYISAVLWSRSNINSQQNVHSPAFPIKYGRLTHTNEDDFPAEAFPNANGGAAKSTGLQIKEYFFEKFGFNESETVTILGAHTFGGARTRVSGHAGMWTEKKNDFSNEFFENVVEPRTRGLEGDTCNG